MIAAAIVYLSHYCYFAPFPQAYYFLDPIYQLAMLSVYPLFHIYIRILTIDISFSGKKHGKFMALPITLFILYSIGIIISPYEEYKIWITNRTFHTHSLIAIQSIYILIRIVFLWEVVYTISKNYHLIKRYSNSAKEYYADPDDSSTRRAKITNTAMLITGISSVVLCILGREFFVNNLYALTAASVIFSSSLFTIGRLGLTQKIINPFKEPEITEDSANLTTAPITSSTHKEIIQKIEIMFKDKHIYMHNKFNISDLARAVGTNRTYISTAINQTYGVNFSNFVNQHRLKALEKALNHKNNHSLEELATISGFGSVDSMKRAVKLEYSMNFREWRKELLANNQTIIERKTQEKTANSNLYRLN